MKNALTLLLSCLTILNAMGQCFEDRHTTNWSDSWLSCERSPNPIEEWGETHWIMYDLGQTRQVGSTHFWNYNDPIHLDRGFSNVFISTSITGQTWQHSEVLYFPEAPGFNDYEGFAGPTLDVAARYILITAKTTHGSEECAGLSEVRFEISDSIDEEEEINSDCLELSAIPNPFEEQSLISIFSECVGTITYRFVNAMGQTILSGTLQGDPGLSYIPINGWPFPPGIYQLQVKQGTTLESLSLVAQ